MTQTFTLAHLSDVHLPLMGRFDRQHLDLQRGGLKRTLGALNWSLNRRGAHLLAMADSVREAVRAAKPDHIVVTGDLTNLGLATEIERARRWIDGLGLPDGVSVIPGNHDLYVPEATPAALTAWAPFMASDGRGASFGARPGGFPYLRILTEPEGTGRGIALIGLNSGAPRPPFNASGALGPDQLRDFAALLRRLGADFVRVVLIHHPPLPGLGAKASRLPLTPEAERHSDLTRGLNDAAAFAVVLAEAGAELVLHGHNHRDMLAWAKGPDGAIPIVGARSASLAHPHRGEDAAGYVWIEIDRRGLAPIHIEPRTLAERG